MALIDRNTPERPELPTGDGKPTGGGGGGGIRIEPREFFAGVPKQNKNYNPPKVF
jgi:hypothetical protein